MKKGFVLTLEDFKKFFEKESKNYGVEFVGWSDGGNEFEFIKKENKLTTRDLERDMSRTDFSDDDPKIVFYWYVPLDKLL